MERIATQKQKEEWLSKILSHFLHITFTDAATKEMEERITKKCLYRGFNIDTSMIPVLTFNAFDMDLLNKFYKDLDFSIQPTVIDVNPIRQTDKVLPLITGDNQISGLNYQIPVTMDMGRNGIKGAYVIALRAFELIKDYNIKDAKALKQVMMTEGYQNRIKNDSAYEKLLKAYHEYKNILKTEGLITFKDQEPMGIRLMDLHPDYLNKLGFWHVIIDEFQDSNDFNMEFVRRLQNCRDIHGGTIKSILVIGDSDQSIYSFRNADIKNFNNFENRIKEDPKFKNDEIDNFSLVNNYRSTKDILDIANRFISKNKNRNAKQYVAVNGKGDNTIIKGFDDFKSELSYCIEEAKKIRKEHPNYSICFMTRNKKNLLNISKTLSNEALRWVISAPTKVVENVRVMSMMNLFKCFNDMDSTQGIYDYLTVLYDNHFKDLKEDDQKKLIMKIRNKINDIIQDKDSNKQSEYLHHILDSLDDKEDEIYMDWKDMIYSESRLGCQKEKSIKNEPLFIREAIRKFRMYGNNVELKLNKEYVSDYILTTAHSSKGLEYDVVFVFLDDFDGYIYHNDEKALEEERRLLFVAMTRAKKKLFCTGSFIAYKNKIEGEVLNQFLKELQDAE